MKTIPPAKYTADEYHIDITVLPQEGRAMFLVTREGQPLMQPSYSIRGPSQQEVPPQRKLAEARVAYRHALFHAWDHARIEALGGISETVRYNASLAEWEAMQTFHERIILPKGAQRMLRRAVAARKKAEAIARRATEATREAVVSLTQDVGMRYNDAGAMLGISKMRVCQILAVALPENIPAR